MYKKTISINTSIIYSTITTIMPIILIFELSNNILGVLLKITSVYICFLTLYNLFFSSLFEEARSFGAGIVINMILFSLFWGIFPEWNYSIIFVFLFLFNFGVMKSIFKKNYNNNSL